MTERAVVDLQRGRERWAREGYGIRNMSGFFKFTLSYTFGALRDLESRKRQQ